MQQLNNSTNSAPERPCGDLLLDVVPVLMAAMRLQMVRLKPPDLTTPQFRICAFLYRQPGQALTPLTDLLGLTLSSLSKLVDGLVAAGYVRHEVCPEDRRRARLYLTARGRAAVARVRTGIGQQLSARLATLGEAERRTIAEALGHLQQVFPTPE